MKEGPVLGRPHGVLFSYSLDVEKYIKANIL